MEINRFRSTSAAALTLALSLSLIPPSIAADLPNGKCTTIGKTTLIKGVSYKCSQKGSSKLWLAVSKASLNTEDSQLEKIFTDIELKINKSETSFDVAINVDPVLAKSTWAADSVASTKTALKLLDVLGISQSKPLNIYIAWKPEYLKNRIPSACGTNSGGGSCGNGDTFANLNWFATNWGYGGVEKPYKWEMDKFIIRANIPHEIGHVAQEEIRAETVNPEGWKYLPAWLREGSAEYFKFLVYAHDSKSTYKHLHDLYLGFGAEKCLKVPLSEISGEGSSSSGCEYTKGLFAVEYLILKTKSVDSIFGMSRVVGTSSAEIFKKAYGINLSDFQKEADAYFARLIATRKQ